MDIRNYENLVVQRMEQRQAEALPPPVQNLWAGDTPANKPTSNETKLLRDRLEGLFATVKNSEKSIASCCGLAAIGPFPDLTKCVPFSMSSEEFTPIVVEALQAAVIDKPGYPNRLVVINEAQAKFYEPILREVGFVCLRKQLVNSNYMNYLQLWVWERTPEATPERPEHNPEEWTERECPAKVRRVYRKPKEKSK